MIVEPEHEPPDLSDVDVCIVGGGAAGIALAVELAGSSCTVVLVQEGGSTASPEDRRTPEVFPGTPPQLARNPHLTSYLGGNTNHWYGNARPLEDADFSARSWIPHSGWPLRKADLDPYYDRAQVAAGLGPSSAYDVEAARHDLGREAPPLDSDVLTTRLVQTPPVFSLAAIHERTLRESPNVVVLLGCRARRLRAGSSEQRVDAVELVRRDGTALSVAARRFVMAGGGVENPRLLLASDEVMARTPRESAAHVGRYFQEHWYYEFATGLTHRGRRSSRPSLRLYDGGHGDREQTLREYRHDVHGASVWAQLVLAEDVAAAEQVPGVALWFSRALVAPPAVKALKQALRTPRAVPRAVLALLRHPVLHGEYLVRKALVPGRPSRRLTLIAQVEQVPDPRNRVALSDRSDENGDPEAELTVALDADQRRRHARALTLAADALGLDGERLAREMEQKYRSGVFGFFWHHMGTTRMSADPALGVVDEQCRAHGWENLYLAGSSVFPTSGTAGPTLTIVALALRLADHLRSLTGQTAGSHEASL